MKGPKMYDAPFSGSAGGRVSGSCCRHSAWVRRCRAFRKGPGLSPGGGVAAGALRRGSTADHPVDRPARLPDPPLRHRARPAIAALFLYSLLPILNNTATALLSIDPVLRKVSVGMGLTAWQRLRYIELPLAAPTILAGIKTAAVINPRRAACRGYWARTPLTDHPPDGVRQRHP